MSARSARSAESAPGIEVSKARRTRAALWPKLVAMAPDIDVDTLLRPSPTPNARSSAHRGGSQRRSPRISPSTLRHRQLSADIAAVASGLVAALAIGGALPSDQPIRDDLAAGVITGFAWMLCLGLNRLYLARSVARLGEELRRIAASGLAASGLTIIVAYVVGIELGAGWSATSFGTVGAFLVTERLVARRAFARMRTSGRLRRRVAIIGTDANAQDLFSSVEHGEALGYDVVGYISVDGQLRSGPSNGPILGQLNDAENILRSFDCVGAMVSLNSVNATQVNWIARELTDAGFHVALSTSLRDFDVTRLRPQAIGALPLVYLEPTIRGGWRSHAKRAFDLLLACIGLVLGAPIILAAAVAIRLDSKGPILFRQVRVGRDGVEFEMFKLRTMTADAESRRASVSDLNESDGPLFKVADDPRITRVGGFLRRTSIDELPQFWNVLRGDMSVVGPRPALAHEVKEWDAELRDRLRVLPGLTGVWQVSGRSSTSFAEYKRLDLYYVDNWSLLHDVEIVMKTFAVVAFQRGAS